jgi:hypothetical protein
LNQAKDGTVKAKSPN